LVIGGRPQGALTLARSAQRRSFGEDQVTVWNAVCLYYSTALTRIRTISGFAGPEILSERERQVVVHAAEQHSTKEIAYDLRLSASTVRVLLHRATRKLGVTSRAELCERVEDWRRLRRL